MLGTWAWALQKLAKRAGVTYFSQEKIKRHCQMEADQIWWDASHHSWSSFLGETHLTHCQQPDSGQQAKYSLCLGSLPSLSHASLPRISGLLHYPVPPCWDPRQPVLRAKARGNVGQCGGARWCRNQRIPGIPCLRVRAHADLCLCVKHRSAEIPGHDSISRESQADVPRAWGAPMLPRNTQGAQDRAPQTPTISR